MKCPNCCSQMFVTDETVNSRSHVTFYRCSLCVSQHVSSEPVVESASSAGTDHGEYFERPAQEPKTYLMA